jgi:hypothetical protein
MNYHRILVGDALGVVTAFAITAEDNLYGLTAGHVLDGQNMVKIWSNSIGDFDDCGRVAEKIYEPRKGTTECYGRIDAGLFSIQRDIYLDLQPSMQSLRLSPLLRDTSQTSLTGHKVTGYSVMGKGTVTHLEGEVIGVQTRYKCFGTDCADLVIAINKPGLVRTGDSGMLWFDAENYPLALHFAGCSENSDISLATFLNRATGAFQSRMLEWFVFRERRFAV